MMSREKHPVLFGRRMKRVFFHRCSNTGWARWSYALKRGPIEFVLNGDEFIDDFTATVRVGGEVLFQATRANQANALNWLTAQRDRLVRSLTPERK